ncbi:MAG TPA: outer membrane beta-barrel protein [Chitinophagaceae bacterium]|nr:outer membrane beta-barrel protein [Chitinophagaceae bacterium]
MRIFALLLGLIAGVSCFSQGTQGLLTGNVMDERSKPVENATVELIPSRDTLAKKAQLSLADGSFIFRDLPFDYYQIRISYVGFQMLVIDSINVRAERADFNLPDLVLRGKTSENLQAVIVYSEKPLIESKDGNITFNAAESPLSAGSNASDLLATVPLVTKDGDGKISVRGKEPMILIDDKPVQLNMQQLQDLLESMPGSSIEKIEVMTNPPPQYANEQGGVINIVTRKGRVGKSGRISLSGGSRGEASVNGNYSYRKQGLVFNINAGVGYNRFVSSGYSIRNNLYTDSSNYFNTTSNNVNKGLRPNFRTSLDYDITKKQSLSVVLQLNSGDLESQSHTEYTNINRFGQIYRLSQREIRSESENYNGSLSISYLLRTKRAGEQLRVIADANRSINRNDRQFYQQFFNPDHTPNGIDSTQRQLNKNRNTGYNLRANYDRPLIAQKTFLSLGSFYTNVSNLVNVDASYLKKPDNVSEPLDLLSNHFRFHQSVVNLRAALRQNIGSQFNITAGVSAEHTSIWFELYKEQRDARNSYWTWLPFATVAKRWENQTSLTASWRRSIRRPGINELNPTVDFSDPYNIRFGNEKLEASTADNFDFVFGKSDRPYFINLGLGYNLVKDIYSRVRTLLPDGKTQISWENISGRKEYEVSTWGGITVARKWRTNISASYTFNQYSEFDRTVNRYRNGGSFTSNISSSYTPKDILNFTTGFTVNRFANPQGFARWSWSMNAGVQRKFFEKRLTVTLNMIDPFMQQRNRTYTYGTNFNLENYNTTATRNFRLTLGYNLSRPPKNPLKNIPLKG